MVDSHGYLGDQSFDCEDEVFAAIDESNPKEKEDKENEGTEDNPGEAELELSR